MSLRVRSSGAKVITSIMDVQARLRTPPPPSPKPSEPPRKRRRRKTKQDGFVVPLEQRNPGLFESCDWVIDGPYRRVPPYFYVSIKALVLLTTRHIIHGPKNVGSMSRSLKSSNPSFETVNQSTIALPLQEVQSRSIASLFPNPTSFETETVFHIRFIVTNRRFPLDPSKLSTMTRTLAW